MRFEADGWSLRKLIRLIVTSKPGSDRLEASERSQELDPDNRLLSHANVRRLEAEAIRDVLLTVSGRLEHQTGGAPVDGNAPRRSVYVRVRRNSLDPFLRAFDFPEPSATVGRRDVTNVPAQSLTMLNDQQISGYATAWAQRVLQLPVDSEGPTLHSGDEFRTSFCQRSDAQPAMAKSNSLCSTSRQRRRESRSSSGTSPYFDARSLLVASRSRR